MGVQQERALGRGKLRRVRVGILTILVQLQRAANSQVPRLPLLLWPPSPPACP